MNKKVLIVSFSFEQEQEAFQVLRDGGLEPVLWPGSERKNATEQDLIAYWNSLEQKPSGILMGADVELGKAFLDHAADLAAVSLNCAGYDHLDLEALAASGVKVCNVPRQNFSAVADLAWGLILGLMRKIPQGDRTIRAGKWVEGVARGIAVSGKTIGILGVGAVGQAVAKRSAGFEMEVLGSDPFADKEKAGALGVMLVDYDQLFARSDILVICCPATKDTHHLVNRETLAKMKPTAVVINPSRGAVIDTAALVEALEQGKIAGAALDVFETEPLYESPLLAMENTVLTPHMGGLADREIHNVAMQAARNMVELLTDPQSQLHII